MSEHVLRLLIALPLICGMIVASLWAARRIQARGLAMNGEKLAKIVEVQAVAPGVRLAVIGFADERILVGIDKAGMHRLSVQAAGTGE